jgi:hypothetical protein
MTDATAPVTPRSTPRMPQLGQTVLYTLTAGDVRYITGNRQRSEQAALASDVLGAALHGAEVRVGDVYAATVVRVHSIDPDEPINLQVHLDGNDTYWTVRRSEGTGPGTWTWPGLH